MCMFHAKIDGEDIYIGDAVPQVPDLTGVKLNQAANTVPSQKNRTTADDSSTRENHSKRTTEIAAIAASLPEEPNEINMDYIYGDDNIDVIGANLLIWERIPMAKQTAQLKEIMEPEDWEAFEQGRKPYWGVKCKCTFCGDRWAGYWRREKQKTQIFLPEEETGYANFGIDGWDEAIFDGEKGIACFDSSSVTCPNCGRWLWVTPKRFLRNENKVYRTRIATMETNGEWGGVFYWMEELPLDREGDGNLFILPERAVIVSKAGELLQFAYEDGAWCRKLQRSRPRQDLGLLERELREQELRERMAPSGTTLFRSSVAGDKDQKDLWITWGGLDGFSNLYWPENTGGMGKTGVEDFCRVDKLTDEPWIVEAYLWFWDRQPRVEVLARDGWNDLVRSVLREEYPALLLDWTKTKPHQILGLSKTDYRETLERYNSRWDSEKLLAFRKYNLGRNNPVNAQEFNKIEQKYNRQLLRWLREAEGKEPSAWDLRKMDWYLSARGNDAEHDLELLVDYRIAANALNALHTSRDLWPKDLQAEHDKACASLALTGADVDTCLAFRRLQEELAPLTWTDGTYMIRAAASPEELNEEGRVLRHCVGTYARAMAAREDVIFFVRKYRRPERSWLTLDIHMSGEKPTEAALHGWLNEGTPEEPGMPNKKPKRKIPKRGRDFIERWKKEVLEPWWEETHKTTKRRRTA